MITLIVKGNRFQAARAAADRGIPFAFVRETRVNGKTETIGRTSDEQRVKVIAWAAAASDRPGTCLWYGSTRARATK